jgi:ACS family sodium-dependent inorganic phosphate cotransporter
MAAAVGTVRVARGDQGGGDGGGGGGSSNGGGGGAQGPREADGPGEGLGARGRIVLLLFWSTFAMYLVRVNLSDSILQMEDEFHWSHTQKGVVLASFFFGYIVGQVRPPRPRAPPPPPPQMTPPARQLPGGALAVRFGGKRVLLFAVGWAGVCAALTPLSAGNLPALVAVRVVMGVGESVAYPAILQLLSAWSPLPERSLQCNVAYSGATLGVIFSLFVTPFTMGRGLGWQCSFYLYGAHALLWCVAWAALAAATPEEQPGISQAEVAYIRKVRGGAARRGAVRPRGWP